MMDEFDLTCTNSRNERPRKTEAIRRQAAEELVALMVRDGAIQSKHADTSVLDIVKVTRYGADDGYRIAKALDDSCGWDCDLDMAQHLDQFQDMVSKLVERAEKQWAQFNPREPEFASGAPVIWRGKPATVSRIHEHRPQCYELLRGEMPSNSFFVVPFEDVTSPEVAP